MKVIGVNCVEVMFCCGEYMFMLCFLVLFGYEVLGIVVVVGCNVMVFVEGDVVSVVLVFLFVDYGMYGEVVNVFVYVVVKYLDSLLFEEVVVMWMMFVMVYGVLIEFGGFECGDVVLIGVVLSSVG